MKLITGLFGITAIQGVAEIPPISNNVEIGKLLVQLVVGIVTIWKLLKKPKNS